MSSSFFFRQAEKDQLNERLLSELEAWSSRATTQVYVVDRPLGDDRYDYSHEGGLVILSPGRKICLVNFGETGESFEEFVDDFIEDVGSVSDKYEYKDVIGRPRKWRDQLVEEVEAGAAFDLEAYPRLNFTIPASVEFPN